MKLPVLTNSSTKCFLSCPRKFEWSYVHCIKPATPSEALRIGTATHNVLEAIEKRGDVEAAIVANGSKLLNMYEQAMFVGMMRAYITHWGPFPVTNAAIAVEAEYKLPIRRNATKNTRSLAMFAGKMDVLGSKDTRNLVVEHKTTSLDLAADSEYWKRISIDTQPVGYVRAGRTLGYQVDGVLYNVIRKPEIRPKQVPQVDDQGFKIVLDANGQRVYTANGKKPRETADTAAGYVLQTQPESAKAFEDRVYETMLADRPRYFARREVGFTHSDITEHEQQMYDLACAIRDAKKRGFYSRNVSQCVTFGTCEYIDVCRMTPEDALASGRFVRTQQHTELSSAGE